MEKKTMGSFLAALRRANGMTQKELAERLNVSDKSVSRWERDDGAPDLALIPVIAEVFGVTCDELLRGERAAAGEEQGAQSTPKGEQQKKHLLAASLSRFRSRCCIALALAAALLCQLVAVVAQRVGHAAHGAAPDGRERAVFFQQRALSPGEIEAAAAVAAAEELVGVSAQRVEQPQQHVLLGEADAGLVVADGAGGNAELLGQRRARQAAGLAARLELIAEAHGKHLQ